MTYAQIKRRQTVPWWAILGAPLVGVPAVVAVLALVAPGAAGDDHDVDFAVEQVEIDSVNQGRQTPPVMLPLSKS